jgi:hypothetical protein
MHPTIEAKFLVHAARTYLDSSTRAQLQSLLQEKIDWPLLYQMAHLHGITPLLYTSLRQLDSARVPPAVMQRLHQEYEQGAQWNLYLTHELLSFLKLLDEHGIAAVPYKGPILAQEVYGNLALRHFVDLDVIIHKADVPRIRQLLSERGYQPRQPLTPFQDQLRFHTKNTRCFIHRDKNLKLDLHWGVTMLRYFSFPITEELFWSVLQRRSIGGVEVAVIPPEEMLQFLCIHASRHQWILLKWVCDVAELIRQNSDLQWSKVIEQAKMLGNLRILWLGLYLANHIVDAPLPATIQAQIADDSMVERLGRQIERLWFCPPEKSRWKEKIAVRAYLIGIKERWQDRLPRTLYFYGLIPIYSLVSHLTRRFDKTSGVS